MKKIILILMVLAAPFISKAQSEANGDRQAETMLKTFYTAYITAFTGTGQSLKSLRAKYCTLKCQRQFAKLAAATDGDPLIKGQDVDAGLEKTLVVSKDNNGPNAYSVAYNTPSYDNAGNVHQVTITINLMVINQNGSYRIDAIR